MIPEGSKVVIADIETDGLKPSKVHCLAAREYGTSETVLIEGHTACMGWLRDRVGLGFVWVFHNGTSFDHPVIAKFLPEFWGEATVDTMVVSRLKDYTKFTTHSLREWGDYLKFLKGDYVGGWDEYDTEMGEYCKRDVDVTLGVFKALYSFIQNTTNQKALKTEHEIAAVCRRMQDTGFPFDKEKCEGILAKILEEKAELEAKFNEDFPPKMEVFKRIKDRRTKDGARYANVLRVLEEEENTRVTWDGFIEVYRPVSFDPGSPKKRIDVLWDAGWKPWDKTDGHKKFLRDRETDPERKAKFERYGWKCNLENLETLPDDAPQSAKNLSRWITLEGRRSTAVEWLGKVADDERIHGKFWGLGAWTHRMAHSAPNCANIFSNFDHEPTNSVEEVKAKYDSDLRSCWTSGDGWLVGTDADGIQLRILAHIMESDDYSQAILEGDKAKGTDIHSMNKKALGPICRSRDDAKTFIYAWLLGASTPKIASILGCSNHQAKDAVGRFLESIPELKKLKEWVIPQLARKGYFTGLDGRRVPCTSEHLMLAGMLQNGEAVVMKTATLEWMNGPLSSPTWKDRWKLLNFVHDEWQTWTSTEGFAHSVGVEQAKAIKKVGKDLNLYLPLDGSFNVGRNWKETH